MTSYQKLKARIKALEDHSNKLLTDPEYYITESMRLKIANEVYARILFGDSKPSGTVKGMKGLIKKITRC